MMAPKTLLKTLKYKPHPMLTLDVPEGVEKAVLGVWVKPKTQVPEPTPQELVAWAKIRARQDKDEEGRPVEGWVARIDSMKADGRLFYSEEDGLWHRRG